MTAQRKIEKEIFTSSSVASTNSGTSEELDLFSGANCTKRWSAHLDWTVNAFTNKTFTSGNVNTTDDTITITSHGYETGLAITLTTTGTLPSPFLTATTYYIIVVDANTISLATSKSNAFLGTVIDITTTGSGTQTVNVTALAGGVVTYQASNDGVNWADTATTANVTTTGGAFATTSNQTFRYIRFKKDITSGSYSLRIYYLAIEEKYNQR